MNDPDSTDHLRDRLDRAAPPPPDLAALGAGAETSGRRRRARRRGAVVAAAALAVAAAVVVPVVVGGDDAPGRTADADPTPSVSASPSPTVSEPTGGDTAPPACLPAAEVGRTELGGDAVWARFCPGREGFTIPAEVPADALTSHLDALDDLLLVADRSQPRDCYPLSSRTYRLQVGYADGTVAQISGPTDPTCLGRLDGAEGRVSGRPGLGVFGTVMAAFGEQVAEMLPALPAVDRPALACPADPRNPASVDSENPAVRVPAWNLGTRAVMNAPATAVTGILCRWPVGEEAVQPTVTRLTPGQAERVRIGLHAVAGGMADCAGSPRPTYTAVVEDASGTRRAVTMIDSECGTVVGGSNGYGLGFPWLDR
ncbi:hypothetical protein GCM10023340_35330 [Nocardioides marinquilinus]|uniref:Uncharacterized protein n=1 Tax=Nocardioides marinquilinus TaxID=1210400 RepID=A0ABP9PWQ6_9ACTN